MVTAVAGRRAMHLSLLAESLLLVLFRHRRLSVREPGYLTDHRTEEPRRHHLRQLFRVRHGTNLHPKTQLDNPAIPSNRRGDNERKRGTLKTGSFLHFALVFLRSVCPLQLNYVG